MRPAWVILAIGAAVLALGLGRLGCVQPDAVKAKLDVASPQAELRTESSTSQPISAPTSQQAGDNARQNVFNWTFSGSGWACVALAALLAWGWLLRRRLETGARATAEAIGAEPPDRRRDVLLGRIERKLEGRQASRRSWNRRLERWKVRLRRDQR